MAKTFARQTKLNNISGRSEYITDSKRQEEIVFHSKENLHNSWEEYSEFEKQNQKSKDKNNEGREIIIALPHDLEKDLLKLQKIIDEYSFKLLGKNRDFEYAVHWNEKRTNLHAHIIYSERERINERDPKSYKRDMWYDTQTNKMAKANSEGSELRYSKGDIMKDKEGNLRYSSDKFTKKDTKFKNRKFNEEIKEELKDVLNKHDFKYRLFNPKKEVAQIHVGHERSRKPDTYKNLNDYNQEINKLNRYLVETKTTPHFYKYIFKDLRIENKAEWQFPIYEKSKEINDLNYDIKYKRESISKNKEMIEEFYTKIEKREEIKTELDKVTKQKYTKWNFIKAPVDLVIKKVMEKDLKKLNIEKEYEEYNYAKTHLLEHVTPMHKEIAEKEEIINKVKKKVTPLVNEVKERKYFREDDEEIIDKREREARDKKEREEEIKKKKEQERMKEKLKEEKPSFKLDSLEKEKQIKQMQMKKVRDRGMQR